MSSIKFHDIPKDFVLMKASNKMSQKEIDQRYAIWKVLDFRQGELWGSDPGQGWDSSTFGGVLDAMRELNYAMAIPIINTHFAKEFNRKFPNFKLLGGRRVNRLSDVVEFVHAYNPSDTSGLPVGKLRSMIFFCLYTLWGKSNYWAYEGELEILKLLQFRYDGNRMCDGSVKRRNHLGGFIKAILVKKLDMERGKLNEAWCRTMSEKFFTRDVYMPKQKESEGEVTGKKADKSHLRKYCVYCEPHTHGFKGGYLLLESHPDRRKIDGLDPCKTPQMTDEEKKEKAIAQIAERLRKRPLSEINNLSFGSGDDVETSPLSRKRLNFGAVSGTARCAIQPGDAIRGPPPPAASRHKTTATNILAAAGNDSRMTSKNLQNEPSSTVDERDQELNDLNINDAANEFGSEPMKVSFCQIFLR